jgi:hypothetical protein
MKAILRKLGLGAAVAAFLAVGGTATFAQDACGDVDAINALYQSIVDTYRAKDVPTFQKAVDSGKQFLEKYGNCEVAKQNADWIKGNMPNWEKRLADMTQGVEMQKITARFDADIQAKNWDDAYAAAAEYASKFPSDQGIINKYVPLAWIGFQETNNKNFKYNANAVKYAKTSLEMLRAGAPAKKNGGYGAFQFECTSKDECISFLTYAIGVITYYGDSNKQAALP